MLPLCCGCNRCCFPVLPLLSFLCWSWVFVRFQCYPQVGICAVNAPLPIASAAAAAFLFAPVAASSSGLATHYLPSTRLPAAISRLQQVCTSLCQIQEPQAQVEGTMG